MGLASAGSHPYTGYPTSDDEIVVVGAPHPAHWERFCRAIDREDLVDDGRFRTDEDRKANREALNDVLAEEFRRKPRDEWEAPFLDHGLPVGPIHSVAEAVEHEFTAANGVRASLEHPEFGTVDTLNLPLHVGGERQRFESPPPRVGEHSEEVLAELGLAEEEIRALARDGVI